MVHRAIKLETSMKLMIAHKILRILIWFKKKSTNHHIEKKTHRLQSNRSMMEANALKTTSWTTKTVTETNSSRITRPIKHHLANRHQTLRNDKQLIHRQPIKQTQNQIKRRLTNKKKTLTSSRCRHAVSRPRRFPPTTSNKATVPWRSTNRKHRLINKTKTHRHRLHLESELLTQSFRNIKIRPRYAKIIRPFNLQALKRMRIVKPQRRDPTSVKC